MKTLREYIKEAEDKKVAIGHFNISNLEGFHGVYNAVKRFLNENPFSAFADGKVPIIFGLSEGEEDFFGKNEAIAIIRSVRDKENYPVFLNADHHYTFERVKDSIDAGFDSAIFDGANLSFAENVKNTKQCVDYARSSGRDVLIEAELGYIGSGSNIKDVIPEGAGIKTNPEEAKKFVSMTGIDMLAPSVGNIHGVVKGGNPHIDASLVAEIKKSTEVPLVLHGGSGIDDTDFTKGVKAGISVIHISTEIRLAYAEALKKFLLENPNEIAPYKILQPAVEAIQKVVEARLKLFNKLL